MTMLPVNLAISGSGKAYLVGRHMWRDFFIIEKRGNYYSFPNDQNLPKTGKELAYWSISRSQFYRAFICIDIAVIYLYTGLGELAGKTVVDLGKVSKKEKKISGIFH